MTTSGCGLLGSTQPTSMIPSRVIILVEIARKAVTRHPDGRPTFEMFDWSRVYMFAPKIRTHT